MSKEIRQQVAVAVRAVENKKGEDISILEMDRRSGAFTDYFILCSGTNPRQVQAIADEVREQLERSGTRPNSVEGYNQAEWVLLDYVHFVVHIFSPRARSFYDLERLWKSAVHLESGDLLKTQRAQKKPGKKVTGQRIAPNRGRNGTRKRAKVRPRKAR